MSVDSPTPAPGRYTAITPTGQAFELVLAWRDGVLRGRTPEAERRASRGEQEGPGVPVVDLVGWRLEPIVEEAA